MRIHREGYFTLAVVAGVLLLLNRLLSRLLPPSLRWLLCALIFGFFVRFFRNPARVISGGAGFVLSPADGTVVAVERVHEDEFFRDERLKISIYMSAFNVHLNRIPVSGKVVYARYHPGQYLVAFHPKASDLNERQTCVIETPDGRQVMVRQIAGFLARRIRFYPQVGQTVTAGDELGFIKFGSRCDVILPPDCRACVEIGQRVMGGETILVAWL